jgi:hypothetical protein
VFLGELCGVSTHFAVKDAEKSRTQHEACKVKDFRHLTNILRNSVATVDPAADDSTSKVEPGSAAPNYKNLLGDTTMRFMVIVKADKNSEAGVMPSREILTAMGKFNEELVKAGVMLAGEGLHPTSKGKRVRFSGGKHTVIDGPFTESKELIAGFWLWQVRSMEEAVEWLKRSPFDGGTEIEIRQVFEADDFGAELTPELREQEARLRKQSASRK